MSENQDQEDIVRRPARDEVSGGLRLADDFLRVGDRSRAAEAYAQVADLFAERGDVMQAVAVCYRALQVEPARFVEVVGDVMLRRLGPAARPLLERAREGYESSGNFAAAAAVTRKLIDRDPDSTEERVRLAELLHRGGRVGEAIEMLWFVAQALERNGNNAELIEVASRLLEIHPNHIEGRRSLARAYLRVGDLGDCLIAVRPLVVGIDDVVGLEVFARLQIELGRNDAAFEALRRLAVVRAAAGEHRLADEVLARAARWAFDDLEFRERISDIRDRLASGGDFGPERHDTIDGADATVVELDIELTA